MVRKKNNIIILDDNNKPQPTNNLNDTQNKKDLEINSTTKLNDKTPNKDSKDSKGSEDSDIITISQLKGKETWHYNMLDKFFSNCEQEQIQKMVDIINGNHLISLRFLDWFVTRYCNLYKTTINISNKFCTQNNFNINISYKAQLKSFTKKYFDPFKRKKKFHFFIDKYEITFLTTLGQLNFFRWAMTHDIITSAQTNYRTIILKYDHVNSFFKKHNSNSDSNTNTTDQQSITNTTNSTNSLPNQSNIKNIIIEDKNKKKNVFNIPTISRNICLEL
jgi:hypothetical protein